jgi:hypothetical protein
MRWVAAATDPKQTVVGLEIFEDIAARIRLGRIAVGS